MRLTFCCFSFVSLKFFIPLNSFTNISHNSLALFSCSSVLQIRLFSKFHAFVKNWSKNHILSLNSAEKKQFLSLMRVLKRLLNPIAKFSEILLSVEFKQLKTTARAFSLTHQINSTRSSDWGSKKAHRKVKLRLFKEMADPKIEEVLAPLRELVRLQVRKLF